VGLGENCGSGTPDRQECLSHIQHGKCRTDTPVCPCTRHPELCHDTRVLKLAAGLQEALRARAISGASGDAVAHLLASGDGWSVSDVICTSGPDDRTFEECHNGVSIAMVTAGTFQYRAASRKELLAPGAFMFGNPGQPYECGHEHGSGDRCISFKYAPAYFETLLGTAARFRATRLPPLKASAPLVARACAAIAGAPEVSWEELAVEVAAQATRLVNDTGNATTNAPVHAVSRVTRVLRAMEEDPAETLPLHELAAEAGLSPYHFLRTFKAVAGVTPHQFALRGRLRDAALRLTLGNARVLDVALDCGFGDLSNFNRAFVAEFGVAPRAYRAGMRGAR
jgi:AraC family transcriptional regulator